VGFSPLFRVGFLLIPVRGAPLAKIFCSVHAYAYRKQ
jgi:hypothetical protein